MSIPQKIGLIALVLLGIPVLLFSKPDVSTLLAFALIILAVAILSAFMLVVVPEWRRRRAERQSRGKLPPPLRRAP